MGPLDGAVLPAAVAGHDWKIAPMESPPVVLMTDFGLNDWYVGVMKGVISTVNPHATVIDLTHTVPRHNVKAASFALLATYRYLAEGAVVVVVVDPGVGGARRILCAESARRLFLAPDNGVLTTVLRREGHRRLIIVENDEFFLKPVSTTFHGRDIFAPVAGHLSRGIDPGRLGSATDRFSEIEAAEPEIGTAEAQAEIEWIDGFGNVITNCSREAVESLGARWGRICIDAGKASGVKVVKSYDSVSPGEILGIIGSSGYLEISVREGDAGRLIGLKIGDRVMLRAL